MQRHAYIATNGCLSAQTDVSGLRSSLARGGYAFTDELSLADVVVLSLCGVTDFSAQTRSKQLYEFADTRRKPGSLLVVSGCLPGMDENVKDIMAKADYIVPISKISDLDSILGITHDPLPSHYEANDRCYVKISNGCLDKCSYCAIPNARGRLRSASIDQVVMIAESYARDHANPTVVLVGEDVGAYGRDRKTTIIDLLTSLFDSDQIFKTKIDVLNPWWFIKYPQLADLLQKGVDEHKFVPSLGLPLQSGSNKVLIDMRRPYTAEQYRNILNRLNQIPNFSASTDIIVGFPTETPADFLQTQEFLEQHRFSYYGIWAFSPRPNTLAASLDHLDQKLVMQWQEDVVLQIIKQIAESKNVSVGELLKGLRQDGSRLPISVNAQLSLGDLVAANGIVLYDTQGRVNYEPLDASGAIAYEV